MADKDKGILGTGMAEKARTQLSGRQKRLDDMLAAAMGEKPKKKTKKKSK